MIKLSKTFQYKAIKTWFKIGGALTPRLTARIAYQAFFTRPLRQIPLPSDIKLLDMATVLNRQFEKRWLRGYIWGDSGKQVILAHGWNSYALAMRELIVPLVECGFQVIAFDAPAHGHSEGIRTSGPQYRRCLAELLANFHPYAIIGHSLGGICALSALQDLKQVETSKVITLAAPINSQALVKRFLEYTNLHRFSHHHFQRYIERHLEITPTQFDLQYLYPEGINYSGLIIHDLNDSVIPYAEALKLANIWPQAGLITTIGLEHSGVLKDGEIIKQIIEFIASKNNSR
ncbi:MAG: alpha/beta fold hydrolase [Burkholderiales bacterium]